MLFSRKGSVKFDENMAVVSEIKIGNIYEA